ncbi:MAG TPA: lactate racemase domain-containing protein, partial [Roseiflexaceae bacterium]|nr:lactate racemase domain-containing protein [Roseiflexaceae bacterium]
MTHFPRLAAIRQPVPTAPLADVAQAVRDELARIELSAQLKPGARIGVGAGSRGITDYALVVGTVVAELKRMGAEPFVFPAMGSHGGATAEGQREVLAEWGITEERMGCPIHTAMDVVQVGTTDSGIDVFCDANAFGSDGIIVVNRVKIHTDFHGPTESGLTKMLAIGLGKRQGAEPIHQRGTRGLREEIPRIAAVHLAKSPILCGVAIVEDGAHHVSH